MTKRTFFTNLIIDVLSTVCIIPVALWTLNSVAKASYEEFFVIGSSMQPTLKGEADMSSYGKCDKSKQAINAIKRFDIIVCYYPFNSCSDYSQPYEIGKSTLLANASLKVKRVIGLPGDTLDINNEYLTIRNEKIGEVKYGGEFEQLPFERNAPISNRVASCTLGENEYFVMGDNWTGRASLDCCNTDMRGQNVAPIYKENIVGVVINIEGYCSIVNEEIGTRTPFEDGPIYLL